MRIALLGLGLIGGSVACALRRAATLDQADRIVAWTPTGSGPRAALRDGVIDAVADDPAAAVAGAELVVLAAPPLDCLDLLDVLAGLRSDGRLPADASVTDVASTKSALVRRADGLGLPFVGGHPMAGRELTGYAAALPDLFVDRPWVVVPGAAARPDDIARVERLATACGARPIPLGADEHDAAVAGISHLPLVVAAALVEAVAGPAEAGWPVARGLAASGWRDMTRLARGDVAMATGIAATNAPALAQRVRDVRDVLDGWLADLEPAGGPDPARLADRFTAARRRLEEDA